MTPPCKRKNPPRLANVIAKRGDLLLVRATGLRYARLRVETSWRCHLSAFLFVKNRRFLPKGTAHIQLAADAAELAENLPDGAAIGAAVVFIEEEKHLADLLIRIRLARTGLIVTDL